MEKKTGVELIADERKRHVEIKGWTAEHDDKHESGELASAAICYALGRRIIELWPWEQKWWKPTTRKRNLVKAGALIAAEIDRLQRKEEGER